MGKIMRNGIEYSSSGGNQFNLTPTMNTGLKIADVVVDGQEADLYTINIQPNPVSAPSEDLRKLQINDTTYRVGIGDVKGVNVNGQSVVDSNDIAQIKSHICLTEDEYDALPNTKLSDDILYCIKDSDNIDIIEPNPYWSNELVPAIPLRNLKINNDVYSIPTMEINPQEIGSTDLTSLKIDGVTYNINEKVTPNPSGTPRYELLTIKIGDTIYDIGKLVEGNPQDSVTDGQLEIIKIGENTYNIGKNIIPNPQNVVSNKELRSLQIGEEYYGFSLSGCGYYKEESLISTQSSSSITLTEPYTKYNVLFFETNSQTYGGYFYSIPVNLIQLNTEFTIFSHSSSAVVKFVDSQTLNIVDNQGNLSLSAILGVQYTKSYESEGLIPKMTSATCSDGSVSASSYKNQSSSDSIYKPYYAFDETLSQPSSLSNLWVSGNTSQNSWIMYEFNDTKIFDVLRIYTISSDINSTFNKINFTIEGRINNTWENCLKYGNYKTLHFEHLKYKEYLILLNEKEYDAIKISSLSPMDFDTDTFAGLDGIQVFGCDTTNI